MGVAPVDTTLEGRIQFAAPKLAREDIVSFLEKIRKEEWPGCDAYFSARKHGLLRAVQIWRGKLLIHLNKKTDRFIGSGFSSRLHLAIDIATKEFFAIKSMHLSVTLESSFYREQLCLTKFESVSHIIRLIFARHVIGKKGSHKGFLALPFFEEGDLIDNIIKTAKASRISYSRPPYQKGQDLTSFLRAGAAPREITTCFMPEHQKRIVLGLLNALFEIHKLGYVHRDVKPDNVLIEKKGEQVYGVLCDFGFCITMKDVAARKFAGTVDYCSLEDAECYFEKDCMPPACAANDMWGLGCTLWKMLWLCDPIWFIDTKAPTEDKMQALVFYKEDLAKGLLSLRAAYPQNPVVLLMCDLLEPAPKRPTALKALQDYGAALNSR